MTTDERAAADHAIESFEADYTTLDRVWLAALPMLSLEGRGGRAGFPRFCLQIVVQDVMLRSLQTAEAITHCMQRGLIAPYYLLARSLFESKVLLRWLEKLPEADRMLEVQISFVQPKYATLARIEKGKVRDTDGRLRAAAEEAIEKVRSVASSEKVLELGECRRDRPSWTKLNLFDLCGDREEYNAVYGRFSRLGHTPTELVMEDAVKIPSPQVEAEANLCREMLGQIRNSAERLLGIAFPVV